MVENGWMDEVGWVVKNGSLAEGGWPFGCLVTSVVVRSLAQVTTQNRRVVRGDSGRRLSGGGGA